MMAHLRARRSGGVLRRSVLSAAIALRCGAASQAAQAPPVPAPDAPAMETSLFLIGDAGHADRPDHPVVSAVREAASSSPAPSLILFLGDNAYPQGLPEREDGCPGPVTVDVGPSVRLVLLDTQWWLHEHEKPVDPTSTCPADSEEEVLGSLRDATRGAAGRHVFVAGDHPPASGGPHGGYFPLVDHLFPLRELRKWLWLPLPIVGSAYPLARQNGISTQDLSSRRYRHLRDSLASVFRDAPPLAFLAGHDHGLQVLSGGAVRHVLVSGSGSYDHNNAVKRLDRTRYAAARPGFMRVDILGDGRLRLRVLLVDADGRTTEAFATWLD